MYVRMYVCMCVCTYIYISYMYVGLYILYFEGPFNPKHEMSLGYKEFGSPRQGSLRTFQGLARVYQGPYWELTSVAWAPLGCTKMGLARI